MDKNRRIKEDVIAALLANDKEVRSVIVPNRFGLIIHDNNKIICNLPDGKQIINPNNVYFEYSIIGKYITSNLENFSTDELRIIGFIADNIKYDSNIIYMSKEMIGGRKGRKINPRPYYTAIMSLCNKSIISRTEFLNVYAVNPICIFKGSITKYLHYCKEMLSNGKVIIDDTNKASFTKIVFILNDKEYKVINK